jgi:hypothetical protein
MMTWKEFKEAVEKLGVTDDTKISWIDCGAMLGDPRLFGDNPDPARDESVAISD